LSCSFTGQFGADASSRCVSGEEFLILLGQSSGRVRSFFVRERRRFDSRIRSFKARGRGDDRRRAFSRRALSAATCCRTARWTISANRSRASLRFCACERES
jgi:hypothetical protein